MRHLSIILRALVYTLMVVCIVTSQAFHDEGAAKLMDYKWGDWMVLLFTIGASVFTTLNAYFDRSFADHLKPSLTIEEFNRLMVDWDKPKTP